LYAHNPAAEDMTEAAERFLRALTDEQKKQVMFEFKDAERENFHFVPDFAIKPEPGRKGLTIKEMTPAQQTLALALPASVLSHKGYLKAMSITVLEKILFDMEKRDVRDPERYYVSIFGKPDDHGTWGFRFEGHHLSINVCVIKGEHFACTPSFMGSNPAIVKEGPFAGLEVLNDEEEIGLNFVNSLSPEQFEKARFPLDKVPNPKKNMIDDVLTSDDKDIQKLRTEKKGIAFQELTEVQQKNLMRLVNVYAKRFRPEVLAGTKYQGEIKDGSKIQFCWMGGKARGEHHYYSIQSDTFLIEFVNSQNNANHVHSTWREFDGDFGRDFLKEHLLEHDHSSEKK
jgi:hypothetical protein